MNIENNKVVKEYLDNVVNHVKNKDAHEEIKLEITNHIFEIVDDLMDRGYDESDAISVAVERMGSHIEIGNRLNKVHKAAPDYITIGLALGIILVGIISAASLVSNNILGQSTMFINIFSILGGSVVGVLAYLGDYRNFKKYSYKIYCVTLIIAVLVFITDIFGNNRINGVLYYSKRLSLPIIMSFLISLSGIMELLNLRKLKNILFLIVLAIIPVITQAFIPSLILTLFYMITISVIVMKSIDLKKYKFKICLFISTVTLAPICMIMSPRHRIIRVLSGMPLIFSGHRDEMGSSYMQINSMKVLSSSKIFGASVNSVNIEMLPKSEYGTYLVFTYIVNAFGWAFAILSILLILTFLIRNFVVITKVRNMFGKNIVLISTMMLGLQFISTLLYSIGASPLVYEIPFISTNVVNMFTNCILVGLLSSVYKRKNLSYDTNKVLR